MSQRRKRRREANRDQAFRGQGEPSARPPDPALQQSASVTCVGLGEAHRAPRTMLQGRAIARMIDKTATQTEARICTQTEQENSQRDDPDES